MPVSDAKPLTWALVIPSRDRSEGGVAILAREGSGFCQFVFAPAWLLCFRVAGGKNKARAPQSRWHYPRPRPPRGLVAQALWLQQGWGWPARDSAVRWKVRGVGRREGKEPGQPLLERTRSGPPGRKGRPLLPRPRASRG